jgi:hypothetical protein
MRTKFMRELRRIRLEPDRLTTNPVTEADIAELPDPARRYMRFTGVIGRPRVWSFRAHWSGSFRRGLDQPWLPCEAWQYDTRRGVARIFHMRIRFGNLVPVYVRDTYVGGRGHMLGKIFDTFRIVDEADFKIDTGELVTYLNDAVLFAPSMLLCPQVTWNVVDDGAFDVSLTDHDRTVRARVFVDARGAATDFSTTDRYGADPARPDEMVRARWTTPIQGWRAFDGRRFPTGGKAVWHFESGDMPYADFRFDPREIEFDAAP